MPAKQNLEDTLLGATDGADKLALYDDDPIISTVLEDVFADAHLNVLRCRSPAEIQSAVDAGDVDVVVADTWGPGALTLGGMSVLKSSSSESAFRWF